MSTKLTRKLPSLLKTYCSRPRMKDPWTTNFSRGCSDSQTFISRRHPRTKVAKPMSKKQSHPRGPLEVLAKGRGMQASLLAPESLHPGSLRLFRSPEAWAWKLQHAMTSGPLQGCSTTAQVQRTCHVKIDKLQPPNQTKTTMAQGPADSGDVTMQ